MGSEGVSAAATGDTAVNGLTGNRTMGASTPTHRTHVCVAWCGPDSVETGVSLLSVQPSGQQILSTLTSTVNATRMRTATARTSRQYIPEPAHRNAKLNEIAINDSGTLGGLPASSVVCRPHDLGTCPSPVKALHTSRVAVVQRSTERINHEETDMRMFDVQGIEISAPKQKVFEYLRVPENLPRWAQAFVSAGNGRARLEIPVGAVDVALEVSADAAAGTVDWRLEFSDGSVGVAQSRVAATTRGTCIYSFVLHAPPVALEQIEGALETQSATLRSELATLKALMEK
jgi:hypothetical protein